MAAEWRWLTLREAGISLIDCEHRTPPAAGVGFPYVAIPDLKDGRIDTEAARRISPEHFADWTRKANPRANDVVLSRRCNPGETAFVPQGLRFALGQNLVLLRADGRRVYPPFLRWLVRGPDWWVQIRTYLNVGAVFDSLKCADVPEFRLSFPPIPEQQAISELLSSVDDKIELNRRMNETLEAIAHAIFRSWFVDFDPVRTRAEVRQPSFLHAEFAALFPASLETIGGLSVPKGWQVQKLGEIVELSYGKALKEEDRRSGDVPVYGSNGQVGWHHEVLVDGPGIVVGRKGNPGTVTWVNGSFFPIDTTFYVTRKAALPFSYLFYALAGVDLPGLSADSAVPGLNRNLVYMSDLLVPTPPVAVAFDTTVSPLFAKIAANEKQARTLADIRDSLLPKLMSGEIRVKQTEKFIEAHV